MAFTFSFTSCLKDCCGTLQITDTSGIAPGTSTGWVIGTEPFDNFTYNGETLTSVLLNVYKVDEDYNVLATIVEDKEMIDAYSTVPDINTDIIYSDVFPDAGGKFTDGIYDISITLITLNNTYTLDIKQFLFCQVKCCVEKMVAEIPEHMCTGCNYESYIERVNKATVLLDALKAAACTLCMTTATNTLALLEDICSFNNCNCN